MIGRDRDVPLREDAGRTEQTPAVRSCPRRRGAAEAAQTHAGRMAARALAADVEVAVQERAIALASRWASAAALAAATARQYPLQPSGGDFEHSIKPNL